MATGPGWRTGEGDVNDLRSLKDRRVRTFETGATRDSNDDKPDYAGFMSALVAKRFGEYMMVHQRQADGQLRSSSNWKRGIPKDQYLESLVRHVKDIELIFEGFPDEAREPLEEALCATLFNVQGLLFEVLKEKRRDVVCDYVHTPEALGEWHGIPTGDDVVTKDSPEAFQTVPSHKMVDNSLHAQFKEEIQ